MSKTHWTHFARGEKKQRGQMNKTEAEFSEILERQRLAGEVVSWWYEAISFTLTDPPADKTAAGTPVGCLEDKVRKGIRFTPDFAVLLEDYRIIFYEVKGTGPASIESINRLKVASQTYPFRFYLATKRAKKEGGGFKIGEM